MHALITGATGMLGRELVDVLLAQGHTVRAFARASSDTSSLPPNVEIAIGSAEDRTSLQRALDGIDTLFHVAGYLTANAPFGADDGSAETEWPRYQQINVDWTASLLDVGREMGLGRVVYTSSSSVYSVDAPVPTPENAQLDPHSLYGRSKMQAEAAVWQSGLPAVVIRPCVIYGARDRYFTPLALSLARMPLLPLVNAGKPMMDLVYVRDTAELMALAASHPAAVGRTYNAGPGTPTSLADLAHAYRDLTGKGPHIMNVNPAIAKRTTWLSRPIASRLIPGAEAALTPAGIVLMTRDLHLDMGRARRELGFEPRYSLKDGLAETLQGISAENSA